MTQETISRILAIERQATRTFSEAQEQAEKTLEDAKMAASALYDESLRDIKERAQSIIQSERTAADAERLRIITAAESEASSMDKQASRHFEQAVEFVLNQVTGRE